MATEEKTIEIPAKPLNWKGIIADIEYDMPIPALAAQVGCTKETIYALRRDTESGTQEPRHALGARILSVHARVMAKKKRREAYEKAKPVRQKGKEVTA